MKEEKNIYISEDASYPSLDTLNKYANGELPDDEKEQVEETIENDPFMADVLDGLSESTDLVLVKQSVNRIKLNSQKRLFAAQTTKRENLSKRQSRIAPNKYTQLIIATAAAIAFLFVTVFIVEKIQCKDNGEDQILANSERVDLQEPDAQFIPIDSSKADESNKNLELIASSESLRDEAENTMRRSSNEEVIEEEPALIASRDLDLEHEISEQGPLTAPKPVPDNVTESMDDELASKTKEEESESEIVAAKKKRELEVKREAEARSKIITNSEKKELTAEEIAAIPVQKEQTSLIPLDERLRQNLNKELAESGNTSSSSGYQKPTDAPLMKEEDIKKGEYLKGMAMADLLTEAIRLYDDGSYNASLNNVREVLQSQPENLVAKYYAGGCYFSIKQYKLAIPYLKSVSKIENTDFQDDARWLLARSYVARGKEKNAISELNILITEKTKYSSDAVILMEELKR